MTAMNGGGGGGGLPAGGSVGQSIINTASGTGTWQGDVSWTATPAPQNSWAAVAGWSTGGYRKDANGFVHLRGRFTGGADNTTIFTLPAGYRPGSGTAAFPLSITDNNDATISASGSAFISTAGVVTMRFSASPNRLALDGITFYAEN